MKTLIVIDMQNDFITGALGTPEAVKILPRVREKVAKYTAAGCPVLFTRDTHGEDYLATAEGRALPVRHCIRGSWGWQITDGLAPAGATVIDKPTFGWTHWNLPAPEHIEIVGLCTDICVVSNALILKAMYPEADISVDAACCAGVTPESHLAALRTMQMCQIRVTGAEGL